MQSKFLSDSKMPRIILLEDEPDVSHLFEVCLRDWFAEVDIVKFEDGAKAWKEMTREAPDLLILDWAHPGLTGHELLKRLAAARARFPILLTSEYFERHVQLFMDRGLRLGFLPKPFGIQEFWAAINQLVGPSDRTEMQAATREEVLTHLLS